jgi:hypothetical protein
VSFQFATFGDDSLPQSEKHRMSVSKTTWAYGVTLRSVTPWVAWVRSYVP